MLPLDLWQFGVIDYLEYNDQSKLVKFISSLELTNLIGLPDLTDKKLQEFKFVKWLDASYNSNITYEGIKHMSLHTLDACCNDKITDEGIKHMSLHTLHVCGTSKITYEGIKHMFLHTLYAHRNSNITDEGIKHMSLHTLNKN
jgi:hypothetical protein